MTRKEFEASLISEVFSLDPYSLTEEQWGRAAEAAAGTERGREMHEQYVANMTQEELDAAIVFDFAGLDAATMTLE